MLKKMQINPTLKKLGRKIKAYKCYNGKGRERESVCDKERERDRE